MLQALLVNDASLAGHHGSALVTARAIDLARRAGIRLTAGWDWPSVEKELSTETGFDLIIVNGEGSLHHDSPTARRTSVLARRLAALGVPAYLINASIEANSDEVLAGLAQFRRRYVRDKASLALLAENGISAHHVPDLTLTWVDAPAATGRGCLVVTDASDKRVSRRLIALASTWNDSRTVTLRYPPPVPVRGSVLRRMSYEAKRASGWLRRDPAWSIRYRATYPDLAAFCSMLANETSGIVSGRYHAVCLAIRMGLPFLAIEGNIGKVGSLLNDVGLHRRLVTLELLEAYAKAPEIECWSAEEGTRIAQFLQGACRDAEYMFEEIARDVRQPTSE